MIHNHEVESSSLSPATRSVIRLQSCRRMIFLCLSRPSNLRTPNARLDTAVSRDEPKRAVRMRSATSNPPADCPSPRAAPRHSRHIVPPDGISAMPRRIDDRERPALRIHPAKPAAPAPKSSDKRSGTHFVVRCENPKTTNRCLRPSLRARISCARSTF